MASAMNGSMPRTAGRITVANSSRRTAGCKGLHSPKPTPTPPPPPSDSTCT